MPTTSPLFQHQTHGNAQQGHPDSGGLHPAIRRLAGMFILVAALAPGAPVRAQDNASVRLKDLVVMQGITPVQLTGYGLVVGLDRTGDRAQGRRGSPHTVQSIANMLQRFGITVDPGLLTTRNTAAVLVTATLPAFSGPGSSLDVTVSSLGDARSLTGGVLLQTPLVDPLTQQVLVMAQGPLSTGAVQVASRGSSVKINHTNTGRVPNGGVIVNNRPAALPGDSVGFVLKRPDFSNASRIVQAINAVAPDAAAAPHPGLVTVRIPADAGGPTAFLASLDTLRVGVDLPARVVINERTGTIVAGGNVKIGQVMVTYGNIVVSTKERPLVSQPAPLGQGETVVAAEGSATVDEDATRSVVLSANTDVNQLAAALNELGMTARDVIAIFQAIDRAGALQAELVIL